jgi:hypothetical protein
LGVTLFLRTLSQMILEDFMVSKYLKYTYGAVLEVPIHRDAVLRWPVRKISNCHVT